MLSPSRASHAPLDLETSSTSTASCRGPVVMADDPCEAAFAAEDPSGPRKYYRARYYDPKAGRFIGEDPIRFWSGINFYSYVGNNPIEWRDPFGLDRLEYQNGQISWVTDAGTTVSTYAGVSGPWGKGALPLGTYTGDNLRTRTKGCIGASCADATRLYNDFKNLFTSGNTSGLGIDVSDADWDDFKGQIEDATTFLRQHRTELKRLARTSGVESVFCDFGTKRHLCVPVGHAHVKQPVTSRNPVIPKASAARAPLRADEILGLVVAETLGRLL